MPRTKEPSLKISRQKRLPIPANAEYSASGKYRRRGPRNRFSTQADRESEVDRIIALKTAGLKMADIAEAMKMSIATVYRRMDAIKDLVPVPTADERAAREARAVALLALLRAETARAHELASERMRKRMAGIPDAIGASDVMAFETMRLAAQIQRAELDYLSHMGVFEAIRKEGRAAEVLARVRSHSASHAQQREGDQSADTN